MVKCFFYSTRELKIKYTKLKFTINLDQVKIVYPRTNGNDIYEDFIFIFYLLED